MSSARYPPGRSPSCSPTSRARRGSCGGGRGLRRRCSRSTDACCGTPSRPHGGHEVDTQGDSFFVAFATRTARGDGRGAGPRVLAAIPGPRARRARVRMGLHTGEATTGEATSASPCTAPPASPRWPTAARCCSPARPRPGRRRPPGRNHSARPGRAPAEGLPPPAPAVPARGRRAPVGVPAAARLRQGTRLPTFPGDFVGREPEITAIAGLCPGAAEAGDGHRPGRHRQDAVGGRGGAHGRRCVPRRGGVRAARRRAGPRPRPEDDRRGRARAVEAGWNWSTHSPRPSATAARCSCSTTSSRSSRQRRISRRSWTAFRRSQHWSPAATSCDCVTSSSTPSGR